MGRIRTERSIERRLETFITALTGLCVYSATVALAGRLTTPSAISVQRVLSFVWFLFFLLRSGGCPAASSSFFPSPHFIAKVRSVCEARIVTGPSRCLSSASPSSRFLLRSSALSPVHPNFNPCLGRATRKPSRLPHRESFTLSVVDTDPPFHPNIVHASPGVSPTPPDES